MSPVEHNQAARLFPIPRDKSPSRTAVYRSLPLRERHLGFQIAGRAQAAPSVREGIKLISSLVPEAAKHRISNFNQWVNFFQTSIGDVIDQAPRAPRSPLSQKQNAQSETPDTPEVDEFGNNSAEVEILHQFSADDMRFIDPILASLPGLMRRHPGSKYFEGEEVIASWVSPEGKMIPGRLPATGARPQGGYIMYMANNAQQRAHLHGIRKADGTFIESTGERCLIGLIGARNSSIRHPGGVVRVPRGALVKIRFPQTSKGPTAHQFWNSDEEPGVGNLLFSFHCRDFVGDSSYGGVPGTEMMGQRTFVVSDKALADTTDHGFVYKCRGGDKWA